MPIPRTKPGKLTFPPPQEYVKNPSSFVQSPLLAILTPSSLQLIAYGRKMNQTTDLSFPVVNEGVFGAIGSRTGHPLA